MPPAISPQPAGKRLQMVAGRPVALGEGAVGTVAKARAGHEANAYRVTVVGGDAP